MKNLGFLEIERGREAYLEEEGSFRQEDADEALLLPSEKSRSDRNGRLAVPASHHDADILHGGIRHGFLHKSRRLQNKNIKKKDEMDDEKERGGSIEWPSNASCPREPVPMATKTGGGQKELGVSFLLVQGKAKAICMYKYALTQRRRRDPSVLRA